nr:MAG TPA: hypothetical protein [Bacteriophage sp.]
MYCESKESIGSPWYKPGNIIQLCKGRKDKDP